MKSVSSKDKFFIFFIGLVFLISGYLLSDNNELSSLIFKCIFYYGFIFAMALILPKNRYINKILLVIKMPFFILTLFMPLIKMFYLFIWGFVVPFIICFLVFSVIPEVIFNIDLTDATKIYLIVTLGTIIIILFSDKIIQKVNSIQEGDKPHRQESQLEFSRLFVNNGIAKFSIYAFYFIIIVVSSVVTLNRISTFLEKDMMLAIVQSFATYIAFERITNNLMLIKLNRKDIVLRLFKVFESYSKYK